MGRHSKAWHRRHALQIAAQLPEDHDDALAVVSLVQELVNGFLVPGEPAKPGEGAGQRGVVLVMPDPSSAPRSLASANGSPSVLPR